MSLAVRLAETGDMPAVFALRHDVFVVGQDVPPELERDDLDDGCDHVVAVQDGVVVGTGRLAGRTIGRMAVAEDSRRRGVGAAVLSRLEEQAVERTLHAVELHAQVHALGFYERAGYRPFGGVYLEAGIEHQSMRKDLPGRPAAAP